jgi:hypothetical protein
MQVQFQNDPSLVAAFKKTLSAPRFASYLRAAENNDMLAAKLYQWNSIASRSLYIYLQSWEICLRNRVNDFLCWKYNSVWPYDADRAVRNLKSHDKRKLFEAIERQRTERNIRQPSTSMVVADLSAGFWVSQMNYDGTYGWKHNLKRIFPNDSELDQKAAWAICDRLLTLRNRVAHHEPIFRLPLDERHDELRRIVRAMCAGSSAFAESNCTFREAWEQRPKISN